MAVAIIFQLLYSLPRLLYLVLFKIGKLPNSLTTYFYRTEFICLCIDVVSFILIFIAAIILSAGFNATCSKYVYKVCGDTRWAHAARVAQAGAWMSTVFWIWMIIMVTVTFWRAGVMPWMKDTQPTTSAPPPTQQIPQVSTLTMDTYQPTSPGMTVNIQSDNPYEPDF
ncbi:hypothetical protein Btru_012148 [Bulinus truncatus]|nr:hypothetical protein Btru_012148 [Bulinus truncatus]